MRDARTFWDLERAPAAAKRIDPWIVGEFSNYGAGGSRLISASDISENRSKSARVARYAIMFVTREFHKCARL
jgi:hypothetical protein